MGIAKQQPLKHTRDFHARRRGKQNFKTSEKTRAVELFFEPTTTKKMASAYPSVCGPSGPALSSSSSPSSTFVPVSHFEKEEKKKFLKNRARAQVADPKKKKLFFLHKIMITCARRYTHHLLLFPSQLFFCFHPPGMKKKEVRRRRAQAYLSRQVTMTHRAWKRVTLSIKTRQRSKIFFSTE